MSEQEENTATLEAPNTADNQKIDYLRKTRFLQYASPNLINRLADAMEVVEAPAGSQIIKKGEQGDTMYFVVDGSVRVHDDNIDLTNLGKGAMFGEIAALSPQRRTASITADSDSLLYSVSQELLYSVLEEQPEAARSIIQGLCDHESRFVHEMIETAVKTKTMERELEIGQRIQQGFLPRKALSLEGWDLQNYFSAAREVAGDFYDYFEIKSLNRLAIVIGDVCDKGVGAALFMSLFRSLIRSSALACDYEGWGHEDSQQQALPNDEALLLRTIRHANQYVATTHAQDSMFATIFIALIDPKTGEFSYINAGHESPYLIDKKGNVERLEVTGPVVGLFDQARYSVETGIIANRGTLVSFTDGVSEAKNEKNEEFGDERVLEALKIEDIDAKSAILALIEATKGFAGNAKQFDDITALAVGRGSDLAGLI